MKCYVYVIEDWGDNSSHASEALQDLTILSNKIKKIDGSWQCEVTQFERDDKTVTRLTFARSVSTYKESIEMNHIYAW